MVMQEDVEGGHSNGAAAGFRCFTGLQWFARVEINGDVGCLCCLGWRGELRLVDSMHDHGAKPTASCQLVVEKMFSDSDVRRFVKLKCPLESAHDGES